MFTAYIELFKDHTGGQLTLNCMECSLTANYNTKESNQSVFAFRWFIWNVQLHTAAWADVELKWDLFELYETVVSKFKLIYAVYNDFSAHLQWHI